MPNMLPPARVLIVDDEAQTRYIFKRILSRAGYLVEEASTGEEGLVKADDAPDIIISDVNLPDMLGYDLCRRVKANPMTAGIPVLQISASFVSDESKVQALQGGADSYLVQPIEPAVLLAQVQALLRLKKAESLSSLSARQWKTTFDSLTDGLALADARGTIVRTNRALLSMLHVSPSEVEGLPLGKLFERAFGIPLDDYLAVHRGQPTELRYAGNWLRVRYDAIHSDPAQGNGAVLLLTDITEYKKLQETVKMNERLAATGRLAHIIAHEINNPLEAIFNLLYLMETSGTLDSTNSGYLRQATHELDRISQITKQILAYHRGSKEPLPANAHDVLEGVVAMFRSRMVDSKVELLTRASCMRTLQIHPGEVRQAIGSLIANALDALSETGGQLRVRCLDATDELTQRRGVRFLVSDTGSGIDEEILPRIFGAFFTTKEIQSAGVGLWLTSQVVAKHGGRIRVRTRYSGPYRGTLFDVFLPTRAESQFHLQS